MRWKSIIACLIAVPGLVLALGYWLKPAPETVVVLTPEQEAIQRYSEGTKKASVSLEAFVYAWNKTSLLQDATEKQTLLETDVLLSLRAYVTALEEVPTDTPDLTRIHGILLSAYAENLRQLEQYAEDSKRDPSPAHLNALVEKLTKLRVQEKQYQNELQQYYQTHQVNPAEASLPHGTTSPDTIWATVTSPEDKVGNSWFM
jgi:DNA repair ATPase RecN